MASGVQASAVIDSRDVGSRGSHAKRRWNRIESSSSGRESDDNEVIESSQDFLPLSSSARRMLDSFNIRRTTPQPRRPDREENGRKSPGSDLDELQEDPVEAQPQEFGSCPRGHKRMPQLNSVVKTANSKDRTGVKRKRLEMKESEDDDIFNTQSHLQSLIENDSSSESGDEKENQPTASSSKKLVKTPSTTIEWNESSEESNLEATIVFSEELNDASSSLNCKSTRITAWEVTEYCGMNLINCIIEGEESIVVIKPRRKSVMKGQMLEIEISGNPERVNNHLVYLVDKHRVI